MGPALIGAALGLWVLGFLFLFRIPRCRPGPPRERYPALSVIVPARDEEHNLPALLSSLASQDPRPYEVIVVDDGSTDRTAGVARELGARVLPAQPLPPGWRGKTWACRQGAGAAAGEILLFVDADTFFEPGGLRRIADTFLAGRGAMSVGAYHRVRRPYEQLSAYFNLTMTAGTGAFTVLGRRVRPAGLFGPFLMLDRRVYLDSGGHDLVKDKILENFFLASEFRRLGIPMRCYGGKGAFAMRMYPHGLRDLVQGWTKAFASGAAGTPRLLLLAIVAWIGGSTLPPILLVQTAVAGHGSTAALWLGIYFLYALQLHAFLRRLGSFRLYASLLYPVPLLFYFAVFTRSSLAAALGRKVSWKGRRVDTAPPAG